MGNGGDPWLLPPPPPPPPPPAVIIIRFLVPPLNIALANH
jgi:hypothetical protein